MSEVRIALQQYLTSAMFSNCGFHLVTIGFKKCEETICKPKVGTPQREKYEELVSVLRAWIYSFMKPGFCEDEEEYKISKAILFEWLKSTEVNTILGAAGAKTVTDWVRKVCTHENNFLYYQRKKLRTYHQITTSPHEGTNFGIKSHAAAVRPCHTMLKSGMSMSLQAELKINHFQHNSLLNANRVPLWSNSQTSGHLIDMAESILTQIERKVEFYKAFRVAKGEWEVINCSDDYVPSESTIKFNRIPSFWRVYTVKLEGQDLTCSDCMYQQLGLPSPKVGSVLKKHAKDGEWKGFTHHDVDLAWWKIWHAYAYEDGQGGKEKKLRQLLDANKRVPRKGPRFPEGPPDPMEEGTYDKRNQNPSARFRVRNYPQEFIDKVMGTSENTFEGLSQRAHFSQSGDGDSLDSESGHGDKFESDWCGFEEEVYTPKEPHTTHHEHTKNDHHELCYLLDEIQRKDPDKAKELLANQRDAMAAWRDEYRAVLRNMNTKEKSTSKEPRIHNIMPSGSNKGAKRTYHSYNANPSKRHHK